MPQMYPLLWLNLFMLFSALMVVCVMKISFYNFYEKTSSMSSSSQQPYNKFSWKW